MILLHTSDWHLGRTLYGRRRYEEFTCFLQWLVRTVEEHNVEALIIAGDVFDTGTPSNRAQRLYYQFLKDISTTGCRHVVIIGGNHDSPSLLEAPKELLRFFQVHVVGSAPENIEDEVFTLETPDGVAELIVCAVPYLRDRDIRFSRAGENSGDKGRNLIHGIAEHYSKVCEHARSLQECIPTSPPILATGHLFAAGGTRMEGDGVRDLYVGSLAHVDTTIFPEYIDYLALGHLHTSQVAGQNPAHRYSGSPLPMSFGEAEKQKHVLLVKLTGKKSAVTPLPVPTFQELVTLRGDLETLHSRLVELQETGRDIWLEIIYEGDEIITGLQTRLREAVAGSSLDILRIVNNRLIQRILQSQEPQETLETMTEKAVFQRCLESHEVPVEQAARLTDLFLQTMQAVHDEDVRAE